MFLHTEEPQKPNEQSKKVAILVMDTQGLFDNQTSPDSNSRIFALSTLISSLQIFNVFSFIYEHELQQLQYATEIARFMGKAETDGKCFQSFLFLLRDWTNDEEYSFGFEGGKEYLKKVLQTNADRSTEHLGVRQSIVTLFDKITCYLLPPPGEKVTRKNYSGCWGILPGDFQMYLREVIEGILGHENLVAKQINGRYVKGSQFAELIEKYFDAFQSDDLPKLKNVFNLIVEQQMKQLSEECFQICTGVLQEKLNFEENFDFNSFYEENLSIALKNFHCESKMGGPNVSSEYRDELEKKLATFYVGWKISVEKREKELEDLKKDHELELETVVETHKSEIQSADENLCLELQIAEIELHASEEEHKLEIEKLKQQQALALKSLEEKMSQENVNPSEANSYLTNFKEMLNAVFSIESPLVRVAYAASMKIFEFLEAISSCMLATLEKYDGIRTKGDYNEKNTVAELAIFFTKKLLSEHPVLGGFLIVSTAVLLITFATKNAALMTKVFKLLATKTNIGPF